MKTAAVKTAYTAMGVVLITLCSWITIPLTVPITLQTLAVFLCAGLFGVKRGTLSVIIYLLMGFIGVPVFSGFRNGMTVIFSPTGGYVLALLPMAFIVGLAVELFPSKNLPVIASMVFSLFVCYIIGTLFFCFVYTETGSETIASVLSVCVFPFIIPDAVKLFSAIFLIKRLSPHIKG